MLSVTKQAKTEFLNSLNMERDVFRLAFFPRRAWGSSYGYRKQNRNFNR